MILRMTIALMFLLPALLPAADLTAKGVMKELQSHYKGVTSLQADYQEVFEWTATHEQIARNGTMVIINDNRMHIDNPDQLLVCDGTVLYRFNRAKNQVIIEPVGKSGESLLPKRLLMMFGDDFTPTAVGQTDYNGKPAVILDLTPKDADASLMNGVQLWATTKDYTIYKLVITDLNGNTTSYLLSNIRLDKPVNEADFHFTPPAGAELFDLR